MNFLMWLIIWYGCALCGVVALLWMFPAAVFDSRRAWVIALQFDKLANVTFGGDEDETISARCWRLRKWPVYSRLRLFIDGLAGDPRHCEDSYINEQKKRGCKHANA